MHFDDLEIHFLKHTCISPRNARMDSSRAFPAVSRAWTRSSSVTANKTARMALRRASSGADVTHSWLRSAGTPPRVICSSCVLSQSRHMAQYYSYFYFMFYIHECFHNFHITAPIEKTHMSRLKIKTGPRVYCSLCLLLQHRIG